MKQLRKKASPGRSRRRRGGVAGRPGRHPAPRGRSDPGHLLDRILAAPHLEHVVPRLTPDVLHRIIQRCGLEACGELVVLATSEQLADVFDVDLWRADRAGRDEQFDAERFGIWLEVMVEQGATLAAQKLAELDVNLVVAALAQHARVFDCAAGFPTIDDEDVAAVHAAGDGMGCEVGGYLIVARRGDSWDAIVSVLASLEADHPGFFHRVMGGCRGLSNSTPEVDGLDDLLTDPEQAMFDLVVAREQRRETRGYVTPAQARAFLQASRQTPSGPGTTRPAHVITRAYFRALDTPVGSEAKRGPRDVPGASGTSTDPEESAAGVTAVTAALIDAGILAPQPRGLIEASPGHPSRLAHIERYMQFAFEYDHGAYSTRSQELAHLANTIVVGCSRPFSPKEASNAALAVCNLGLENWPPHLLAAGTRRGRAVALPDDFLVAHDLTAVFHVGWAVLHEQVLMYSAEQLIGVLDDLCCRDRAIQADLDALRIEMDRHWREGAPWRARGTLDVVASLDLPAWAALLGLIDEFPVLHGAVVARRPGTRAVDAHAFEFISENRQIATVREFLQSLPDTLRRSGGRGAEPA